MTSLPPPSTSSLAPSSPAVPPAGDPGPERVRLLIVDDQPINIQALHQLFAPDHQVFMATNGETALALCREKQPDLVLLDIEMPGMDGLAVCARMKAEDGMRHIPIIFVTAHDDEAAETRGLDAGAVDFISKPFNPRVVRARVKTHVTLKRQSDLLQQMAFVDGLTSLYNRRYFDVHLDAEYRRSQRNNAPLSLILIDVDDFKRYNDHYGHQAGDDCLRRVGAALKAQLKRPVEFVARYGGEEFVCLLPDTPFDHALRFAEHLERTVRALDIEHLASRAGRCVTVSLGVACRGTSAAGGEALVAWADGALYEAKAQGRGRACGAPLVQG